MSHTDYPGIIEITGPDTRRLLQGQSTADAAALPSGQWSLGGLATPKGRLYASFYLAALAEDRVWLLPPRRQVPELMARFGKYAAFYKVDVTDLSADWQGRVTAGSPDENSPAEASGIAGAIRVSDNSETVTMSMPEFGLELRWHATGSPADSGLPADDAHRLALQELRVGIAWVQPETTEQFLPQALNWDQLGGVSFSKGCYTGQEVVARLHYKGSSKKGLKPVAGEGPPPTAGERLATSDSGRPSGNIARAVTTETGRWTGLAVLSEGHTTGRLSDGREVRVTSAAPEQE